MMYYYDRGDGTRDTGLGWDRRRSDCSDFLHGIGR
jgi:hypothetical protein